MGHEVKRGRKLCCEPMGEAVAASLYRVDCL